MNMSASAGADVLPQQKYDVFLSFRGGDTRHNFTSHLYAALDRKKIHTYIDNKLVRGDEIGPSLFSAIEQSKLSVIIFSKDYASSSWCLDELVHILKCRETYGQIVIPVFYDIDPSHVRWQQGTYANAFAILEERFKDNMVRKWRDALTTAANLSGVHSQNIWLESELVETIVEDISTKLNRNSSYAVKGLVGMESRIQQIESLLCIHAQDVCFRTVGIWGMGGIGKTTLADAVFHRNSSEFDACLFLENIREETEKYGLNHLRNKLLRKLLGEESLSIDSPSIGSSYIIDRLSRTKVLAVLDDVSDFDQLEFLLGDQIQFGSGSRIMITTRNRRLLKKRVHEDHIYEMNGLYVDEALQLFQSFAFEDDSSIADYSNLSRKVVNYAGCNPLALKVLASSFLHCNNKEDWEDELNNLRKFPNSKIQNVLRLSYDGLEQNEKGIFLDIACFLKGENICDAKKMLEIHGFSASRGVRDLIDRSLISIKHNRLEMHDLLQEMGRAIEGGIEEPGERRRLWNAEDIYHVLKNNTGTSSIEAIFLDVSKIRKLQLSPDYFKNMHNLKLLKFYEPQEVREESIRQRRCNVEKKRLSSFSSLPVLKAVQSFLAKSRIWGSLILPDLYNFFFGYNGREKVHDYDDELFNECQKVYLLRGLESLPEELRYLYWDGYPLKSLPSQYSPENLVELHLPHSQVKQLWNNAKNLGSLRHLNLSDSYHLTEVPDLSGSPNIERIDLSRCTSLVEVPSYFQNLGSLTCLHLQGCTNLKIFWEIPCSLEVLNLSGTAIEELSPSIWSHENLHTLDLGNCKVLKNLPSSSTGKLNLCGGDQNRIALKELILRGCSTIESVPDSIYNSNRLETLNLFGCEKLKRLPPLPMGRLCSLRTLNLGFCSVLESIPDSLICLSTLEDINLSETAIESIPSSIINASGLRKLLLRNCKKLKVIPELPWQLEILEADGCTSLKSVASSARALMQQREQYKAPGFDGESLRFSECLELDESARCNIMGDAQLRIMRMASSSKCDHDAVFAICPGNEISEWFSYRREGCEINNIKFSLAPDWFHETTTQDQFLGFAISAVVAGNLDCLFPRKSYFYLVCECNFKTKNDGEGYQYEFRTPLCGAEISIGLTSKDHVMAFFKKDTFWREGNRKSIPLNKVNRASFHLYPAYLENRGEEPEIKVKKFGIRVLYM